MVSYLPLTNDAASSTIFSALGDPTRLKIVALLAQDGAQRVSAIASGFAMTRPAVSKHLGVLEAAEVIRVEKRGREKICHLRPDALSEAARWLTHQEMLWTSTLSDLAAHFSKGHTDEQS
ncbi:MAG: metalloregulator ArsR/SmtB family transcription factor [Pseudomonadota bacterium]